MKKLLVCIIGSSLVAFIACSDPESVALLDSTNDRALDETSVTTSENETEDGEMAEPISADFTVTIENVVTPKPIFQSGLFAVPVDGSGPAPLFPGDAYEFEIDAGPVVLPGDGGTRLSFVTMFVQSNDLFFAPDEEGIALYNEDCSSICGNGVVDVTDQIDLWDAGTEVNEQTGGPNQKPQQAPDAEDQGTDENGLVTKVTNNSCSADNVLPEVHEVIKVTIDNIGPAMFKVRIENVSDGMTIATPALGEGTTAAVPISPGVYAVHTAPAPFFVEGEPASGAGLIGSVEGVENIAEDGFTEALLMDTEAATGLIVPLSPGVWAVHMKEVYPIFKNNTPDFGEGLEAIAEDGMPGMLAGSLANKEGVFDSGAFDTPVGDDGPGAIGPGGKYQFSFSAKDGDYLSLTTMFVQSNDWIYALPSDGIPLFVNGIAQNCDLSALINLYDAGTEADEYAGAGLFQVIRQMGPNSGDADPDINVRRIDPAELSNIPANKEVIKVTIEARAY